MNIKYKKTIAITALAVVTGALLTGCSSSDADVASSNLSVAAEQFQIERRIVFFNGITDTYLLTIEGKCSVETSNAGLGGSLEVTCKIGPEEYKKHFLGLSDNVSYFVEQLDTVDVDVYRYRVVFKPEVLIPDIDLKTSN
jgi:hypothetical protein